MTIETATGQPAGVTLFGHWGVGVPFVFVHGFSIAPWSYEDALCHLTGLGLAVAAIDVPGHGASPALRRNGHALDEYVRLLEDVVDRIGARRCILAGHSLGGRLVAELAARRPDRALGLVLLSAPMGATWDRLARLVRVFPPAAAPFGTAFMSELFAGLSPHTAARALAGMWQLGGLAVAALTAPDTEPLLERIAAAGVPVAVVHADNDRLVPVQTARDAAGHAGGELLLVPGLGHHWLLDRSVLQRAVRRLLDGPLAQVRLESEQGGLYDPRAVTLDPRAAAHPQA